MSELLDKFEFYCNSLGINLDEQLNLLKEDYPVDLMDVNHKLDIKINVIKNAMKGFLEAEGQSISDNYLFFIIKFSNLI
jgi:hypothetical protein